MRKEYVFLVYRWVKSFQNSGSIFSQKIHIFDDFFEYTNDYRQFIHESSSNFSSSLDNYDRHTYINIEDYNSSYIFFEASSYFNDSSRLSFDQKLKVKLTLPNIKRDIKLIFENEEKDYSNQFNEDIQTNKTPSALNKII